MIYEHWKGRLSAAQQKAYDDVLLAISRRQERIPVKGVQPQELSLIHKAIYYDHPELFYMTHAPGVQQSAGFMGVSVTFLCRSIFSPTVIRSYQNRIEEIKTALAPAISSAGTEYEKEKIVCDYLLKNVTYQIDNTLNQNAGTALVRGVAQCSGIAKAVKLLFDWIGIRCLIIDGEVSDPRSRQRGAHAWNLVCIDGAWYHLDVTLMLGANMDKAEPFQYLYLNQTDAQMRAMHVWQPVGYPTCVTEFIAPLAGGNTPVAPVTCSAPQHTAQTAVRPRPPIPPTGTATHASAHTRVRKTVTSLAQFRRDIANVYHARLRLFEFVSAIPANDSQELLDALLAAACDVAREQNLQLKINVTVSGDVVQVALGW